MPTYDYECLQCGHTFEYFQAMSDDPLSICPKCGKEVRRLIGGGLGIIFKGSGFYVTDNRKSESSGASESKKSEGGKETAASTDKKQESSNGADKTQSKEKASKSS